MLLLLFSKIKSFFLLQALDQCGMMTMAPDTWDEVDPKVPLDLEQTGTQFLH